MKGVACMVGLTVALSLAGCSFGMSYRQEGDQGSINLGAGVGEPAPVPSLDRSVPPEVGSPPGVTLPDQVRFTLDNGLRVVLVERHQVPVVAVRLLIPGGGGAVEPHQAGLAVLAADMLDEGTTTRSAMEIAEGVERLGASLGSFAGWDASVVSLRVVKPRLEGAFEILADVIMNPSFPQEELERVRREQLDRILQSMDEPRALADNAFVNVLFGEEHAYGQPLSGTRESVGVLTREAVADFYRDRYVANNSILIVVGDIDEEEIRGLLNGTLAAWRRGSPRSLARPRTPDLRSAAVYVVDKPGAAQSEIRVGRIGVDRGTEDYFGLTVLNTVLGGSFTSRLNMKLREEKGYTYGAGSFFDMRLWEGPFVARSGVQPEVTDSAVVEFLAEIRRIGEEEIPEEELTRGRNYLALRLPQQFESVSDIGARLSELELYGLPDDFYDVYVDRVLETEAAGIRALAERHLDPEEMVIVVVGDRATIEEPLRRLGIGEVVILPSPERDQGS